jgi:hypothetical protein
MILCFLVCIASSEEIPTLEQQHANQPTTTSKSLVGFHPFCDVNIVVNYDIPKKLLTLHWGFKPSCDLPRNTEFDFSFHITSQFWGVVTGNTLTVPYESNIYPDGLTISVILWTKTPNGVISSPTGQVILWRILPELPNTLDIPFTSSTPPTSPTTNTLQPLKSNSERQNHFGQAMIYLSIGVTIVCALFTVTRMIYVVCYSKPSPRVYLTNDV